MRKLYFLLPGTDSKFACGGLWAELKVFHLAQQFCTAAIVTYRQREHHTLFLDDVLQQPNLDDVIFVLSWGFDVPKLAHRLRNHAAIYHAHSADYGFQLPPQIPIITVSRNTMGYWGQKAPHSLIYYLPNQISEGFDNRHQFRDIDVLVQARKSSSYLMQQLIPSLQSTCKVMVVDHYVEDLSVLFNRAKVYLYDSAEYWALQNVTEGFGLQPLEAFACGCEVFSSVNHGLSDYLDPGFNCQKIAGYSTSFDSYRILQAIQQFEKSKPKNKDFLKEYRADHIQYKLQSILKEINYFFDHQKDHNSDIKPLTSSYLLRLSIQSKWNKLLKRFRSRKQKT